MFTYIKVSALLILISATCATAQINQQVSMELSMRFDVPYVGPINKSDTLLETLTAQDYDEHDRLK